MAGLLYTDGRGRGRGSGQRRGRGREWRSGGRWGSGGGWGRGVAWGGRGGWGGEGGRRGGARSYQPVPEGDKEPLKVFVGNLRDSVTSNDLRIVFSSYAKVVNAFTVKDKNTRRSKGYGFVTVSTPQEVETLLGLRDGDTYIHGQAVSIKPARKRNVLPGDDSYARIPLSDRNFDLEPSDPNLPCIHMLVDDVLFKILEYLPLPALIGVERVCRRWQMIVYKLFAKHSKLNLSKEFFGVCGMLTRSMVSKLLILAGPSLKELKVQNVDYCTKNILRIISQLCPGLESLDVARAIGINSSNLKSLTSGCKYLKAFIAEDCPDFDSKALKEVLSNYIELEKLNIARGSFEGRDFNLLPATLKELKISCCTRLKPENIKMIGDRCPNLEVLEMDQIELDRAILEHIGTHCTKLLELKLCVVSLSCAEALQTCKKLKRLDLEAEEHFEIYPAIQHMSELEYLRLRGCSECLTQSDRFSFAAFKKLVTLGMTNVPMSVKSLSSLTKCVNLKSVQIRECLMTAPILLDILRCCPQLEKIWTPDIVMQQELLTSINEIMKPRTGPLSLALRSVASFDISSCQIDSKKIKLDMSTSFRFMLDDFDDDYDFDTDNESLFSGESYDDEYWMYGYDSDSSLPDAFLYGDNMDFLERHLGLFNFNLIDSDDDFSFE